MASGYFSRCLKIGQLYEAKAEAKIEGKTEIKANDTNYKIYKFDFQKNGITVKKLFLSSNSISSIEDKKLPSIFVLPLYKFHSCFLSIHFS